MTTIKHENCLHNVTVNKKGQRVFHIWEDNPVSPIFKVFKYDYSVHDKETTTDKFRGIETKVVYKSIDFNSLTLTELRNEANNLKEIFENTCTLSNPYYLRVVNLNTLEEPRWYPLPLLFSPLYEQELTNNERGYSELPKDRILELRREIMEFFNYDKSASKKTA